MSHTRISSRHPRGANGVAPELLASLIAVESNFKSECRLLRIRPRLDAIDAGNGGAIWSNQGVRSPAKH